MASDEEPGPDGEAAEADAATAQLLWGGREAPTRGPKRSLDLDDIATAAVRIADADGLAAVSMQRVAGELDVTKMALYRYVSGKAELTAIMIEHAVGRPPDLDAVAGGWREKITEVARQLALSWEEHPWLPWATIGARTMGPREVAWTECAVAAFDATPLAGAERLDAAFVMFGHIRNTQSVSGAGTQPWGTDRQFDPTLRALVPDYAERFPSLTAATNEATAAAAAAANVTGGDGLGPGLASERGRAFGLRCLLDGLAVVMAERA
jgi:AcrR family transcriptional regulator